MSIDTISRIYERNTISSYLFDVPESDDPNAISSYIIRCKKDDLTLTKITDLKDFISGIKKLRTKKVPIDSREYHRFLTITRNYLEQYQFLKLMEEKIDDNVEDADITSIAMQYRDTLKKIKK